MEFHDDRKGNPKEVPDVFYISTIRNGKGWALNGKIKKSIDQLIKRTEMQKIIIENTLKTYKNKIKTERNILGPHMFDNQEDNFGIRICQHECNMKIESYIQPVIIRIMLLAQEFSLTYKEIVAVHLSPIFTPNGKFYLG